MRQAITTDDIIDVRDIIARVEALETNDGIEDAIAALTESEDASELVALRTLLDELNGAGGDEQWRGDWYPVTLIRDDYFRTYAQELAEECDLIDDNATWPARCIDWNQAARELRMDYTSVTYAGITYWTR
jgi:hypothetical protein